MLDKTAADYNQLQQKHVEMAETLALLRHYIFSPRRERFEDDLDQGHLFDFRDTALEPEPTAAAKPNTAATRKRPKAARPRKRISLDHLPHNRVEHDLPETEKIYPCCGGAKQHINEDLSRELELTPAKLEVNVHVLPKYACPKYRDVVASPPVPPKPVPGGSAGPGLVSFVLVSKFADHFPPYRLEDILFRHGVSLSRSTLCDWVRHTAILHDLLAEL